jgi:hypothetical protein
MSNEVVEALNSILQAKSESEKFEGLSLLKENWDEKYIEPFWKVIQFEPIPNLQKEYIQFLYEKRKIKVYPRLFRFIENKHLHTDSIIIVAELLDEDLCKYIDEELTLDEYQDMDFALEVFKKSFTRDGSQITNLFFEMCQKDIFEKFIPKILPETMPVKVMQEFSQVVITLTNYNVQRLVFDHLINYESMNIIVIKEIENAIVTQGKKLKRSKRMINKLRDKENYWSYDDIPLVIKHVIKSLLLSPNNPETTSSALTIINEIRLITYKNFDVLKTLSEQAHLSFSRFLSNIYLQGLYIEIFQTGLSDPNVSKAFVKLNYPEDLENYDFSKMNEISIQPISEEQYQILTDLEEDNKLGILLDTQITSIDNINSILNTNFDENTLNMIKESCELIYSLDGDLISLLLKYKLLTLTLTNKHITYTTIRKSYLNRNLPAELKSFSLYTNQILFKNAYNLYFSHFLLLDQLKESIGEDILLFLMKIFQQESFLYSNDHLILPSVILADLLSSISELIIKRNYRSYNLQNSLVTTLIVGVRALYNSSTIDSFHVNIESILRTFQIDIDDLHLQNSEFSRFSFFEALRLLILNFLKLDFDYNNHTPLTLWQIKLIEKEFFNFSREEFLDYINEIYTQKIDVKVYLLEKLDIFIYENPDLPISRKWCDLLSRDQSTVVSNRARLLSKRYFK